MPKSLLLFVTLASLSAGPLCAQDSAAPEATSAPVTVEPTLEGGTAETSVNTTPRTEAAPVAADPSLELMPSNSDQTLPAPALTTEPLPLIPEAPQSTERPRTSGRDEPRKEKKSSTEQASNEIKERIRFREVKTRALKDPAIQSEWERAHLVGTDYEKRETLKRYFKMLYGRMARIDKTLKKRIATEEDLSIRRLKQTRIDPTEPLDPEEREDRFANQ